MGNASWSVQLNFYMTFNPLRNLLVVAFLVLGFSQVEAQVGYSLSDGTLSSAVRSGPIRNAVQSVRSRGGGVVPTFDRSGRFNRDASYRFNEGRPLAGLFAPDFELTASVFGGWNRIVGFGSDSEGDNVFDDDFAVGIAYGRRHNERLRSEFEFTYRSNEATADSSPIVAPAPLEGEIRVLSIMKNFIIDIESTSRFVTPYVGIGIGYANVDTDFNRESGVILDNAGSFAWQPIGGVSLQLTEKTNFYVEYRYFATTDLEISQFGVAQENSTYSAHDLFVGMRLEF